jgi:hypothetical protein
MEDVPALVFYHSGSPEILFFGETSFARAVSLALYEKAGCLAGRRRALVCGFSRPKGCENTGFMGKAAANPLPRLNSCYQKIVLSFSKKVHGLFAGLPFNIYKDLNLLLRIINLSLRGIV